MGRLCGFDGLKVTLLGKSSSILIRGEAGGASYARGRMELATQDGKEGGPPWLGPVGGMFDRGVGGEERCENTEVAIEPGLKGEQSWERRRGGDVQITQKGGEGVPVSQGPIWRGHWRREDRM